MSATHQDVGEFDPTALARAPSYYEATLDQQYPNLRNFLTGSLFISHSGLDQRRIIDDIVLPVIYDRFADGYFLHNQKSGGAAQYVSVVHAALCLCDKFSVVISHHSVRNAWVQAEVSWALKHRARIVCCLLDDSDPLQVNASLGFLCRSSANVLIDFRNEAVFAQKFLAQVLDEWLAEAPYPRLPLGRPDRYR